MKEEDAITWDEFFKNHEMYAGFAKTFLIPAAPPEDMVDFVAIVARIFNWHGLDGLKMISKPTLIKHEKGLQYACIVAKPEDIEAWEKSIMAMAEEASES